MKTREFKFTEKEQLTDSTYRVLMIGNSYCYYYTEELAAMLSEQYEKVEIYNLYKSGCTLAEHYNWWHNNIKETYHFFKTTPSSREAISYKSSLEEALNYNKYSWDAVSIQEGLGKFWNRSSDAVIAEADPYANAIIGRIRDLFPYARVMWHQTWSAELGWISPGKDYQTTAENRPEYEAAERETALYMCKKYNLERVNSGEAWILARQSDFITDLCARIEIDNGKGDGYHDGDLGGGQYLNACVWYEVLTGNPCENTTYRPSYVLNGETVTLSGEMIAVLQAAASQAVDAR